MREYKFRAWDGKKMYLPEQSDDSDFFIAPEGQICHTREVGTEGHISIYPRRGWVLMQYTGFQVKETDLYEGDILRCEVSEDHGDVMEYLVCVFISEWGMFGLLTIDEYHTYMEDGASMLDETMFWTFPLDDIENMKRSICGNVYQHPEKLNAAGASTGTHHMLDPNAKQAEQEAAGAAAAEEATQQPVTETQPETPPAQGQEG